MTLTKENLDDESSTKEVDNEEKYLRTRVTEIEKTHVVVVTYH